MSAKTALANVGASISRNAGKLELKVQVHSPEILMIAGIITFVGGTVTAIIAGRKVDGIVEEHKEAVENIHKSADDAKAESTTEEDQTEIKKATQKDLTATYVRTGLKFVKIFAPAIGLNALGVVCVLSSHNILQKRNVALSSAFVLLTQDFNEYRNRVASRFGDGVEKEIYYNLDSEETEVHTVDESGKETDEKTVEYSAGARPGGIYSRYIMEGTSTLWKPNRMFVLDNLTLYQSCLNDRLLTRGYLFLNEAYEELGLPPCDYGQIVGWYYDRNNPKYHGEEETVVDLRITEVYEPVDPKNPDAPRRKCFMIDPNVDGNILDLI